MPHPFDPRPVEDYLLRLYGGDPFSSVRDASDAHRESHGPECGIYPSGPMKMRLMSTIVRATGSKRILEIGCGLGYSALWLADSAGPDGCVDAIDRFPQHAALAQGFASQFGLASRVTLIVGEADSVIPTLTAAYDFIHDDGWFAKQPLYFAGMVSLLRSGGLLTLSNWFLLGDSIADDGQMDWSQFAGKDWAQQIQDYARTLTSHPGLTVAFSMSPWLALAVKR